MESRPCPGCAAPLPVAVTYCPRCGTSLPEAQPGSEEGTRIATTVRDRRPTTGGGALGSPPAPTRSRRRALPLVVGVLAVATVLGVLVAGPLRGRVLQAVGLGGPAAAGATAAESALPSDDPDAASATPAEEPSAVSSPSMVVASDLTGIKVRGAAGERPVVTVPAPWSVDRTWAQTLTRGTGPEVTGGSTVEVNYVALNGRTGKVFDDTFPTPVTFSMPDVLPGFAAGLRGQRAGSRVLLAITGADGYDPAGGQADAGILVGDTLVFVVDIVAVS